ncbi:MAG: hypothetical protein K2M15_00945, partial [Oscillospiraceae bacterium]|nr:hypothetical protein [Oscillospiraceae bacterium]
MKKKYLVGKRALAMAFGLALILLFGAGCDGAPKASNESAAQPSAGTAAPDASAAQSEPPAAGTADIAVGAIPPEPPRRPTVVYRLIFPEKRVFTCEAGYSSVEAPIRLSKDQVENGWVNYEESLVPFSYYLLEHPDASLL